jgi:hypothetical protein
MAAPQGSGIGVFHRGHLVAAFQPVATLSAADGRNRLPNT